jgi:hypothetical protein
MYGIYLCQNNTCHKIWKNYIFTSKLRLWMEFLGEFFYDVWYWYTRNLGPFKDLKFLDEIPFKNYVFFSFLNNKCIIISFFNLITATISKRRFYRCAFHYFFSFILFGNVSWTTNMMSYGRWKTISYILYVH